MSSHHQMQNAELHQVQMSHGLSQIHGKYGRNRPHKVGNSRNSINFTYSKSHRSGVLSKWNGVICHQIKGALYTLFDSNWMLHLYRMHVFTHHQIKHLTYHHQNHCQHMYSLITTSLSHHHQNQHQLCHHFKALTSLCIFMKYCSASRHADNTITIRITALRSNNMFMIYC